MARFLKQLKTQNVFSFSVRIWCETWFVVRRNGRDLNKNVLWSLCTVPAVLVYSTGCFCVQYRLFLCTVPAVIVYSNGCSCVQYRLFFCTVPAVLVYSTGCFLCTVPVLLLYSTGSSCVQYRLFLYTILAVLVFSTGCSCVQYRLFLCSVPAVLWSLCTIPAVLVRFYCNLNFLDRFSKKTRMYSIVRINPVGSQMIRSVRRTDVYDEAIRRFMEMFVSNVFYNNWHLQVCTNYSDNLCCNCAELGN
jgi:hypothetical protein